MIAHLATKLWWRRHLRRNACSWEELETFPRLHAHEQRRVLAQRLLGQIHHFGRRPDALPEWREAAAITDPDELWRAWPSLPIVDRRMLQTRFHPRDIQSRFGLSGKADSTGGSTGEPVPFLHDPAMLRAMSAVNVYSRVAMGWRPGMATVIVWGAERDIGKTVHWRNRLDGRLRRDFGVAGYNLTRQTAEEVLRLVRRLRPVVLYGFTSMLEFVARETLAMNATPRPGSIAAAWNGGEMLFPEQAELFRQAFGVPLLNRYGGRELSAMACQLRYAGPLEVFRPWLFLEVVNAKGNPVGPGEAGRLLWTSTICRGTPFLRYEIGDLGSFDATRQDESGISALSALHGRTASVLELPDGRKISNLYWNHLFKEFSEVRQFQVVVKGDGGIRFLLRGEGFPPAREAQLHGALRHLLNDLPVAISWVDRIPLTRQGKLIQVVRERTS